MTTDIFAGVVVGFALALLVDYIIDHWEALIGEWKRNKRK